MSKTTKELFLSLCLILGSLLLFTGFALAENRVTVQCPVVKPVINGDSIGIPIQITNEVQLGGFTLGFYYNSNDVEITSVNTTNTIGATPAFYNIKYVPADNKVLVGWIDFTGVMPINPQANGLAFTLWMQVPNGTAAQCVNLDSAFVPPAGPFIFSPKAGGKINPFYTDCGTEDIILGGTSCPSGNTAPVVSDIPDQTIPEGGAFASINLDDYVTDAESADDLISWAATSASPNSFSVSIVDRVASISYPGGEFSGSATFSVIATDPGSLADTDAVTFTVTAVNDPPVVSDIPDQTISEGGAFASINLDDYVTDAESADNLISWAATSASPNSFSVSIVSRVASISYPGGEFSGSATFSFIATDPGSLADTDAVTFTVTAVNDPPVVSGIPDQTLPFGSEFSTINLDSYVSDPDNAASEMTWSYSGNVELLVSISPTRVATITKPSPSWYGAESIIFKAQDPGALSDADTAVFTIQGLAAVIDLNPDSLTFSSFYGGSNPSSQIAVVNNIGTGTLHWAAAEATAWLSLAPDTGTAPSGFTVSVDITGLSVGTYTADITVTSAEANNSPQTLKVVLYVTSPVDIKLTPDSLYFYAKEGGSDPAGQDVGITNGIPSGVEFNWGAIETAPWLGLSATSGTTPSTVTFNAYIAGLSPSTYTTLVIVKEVSLKLGITEDEDTVKVVLLVDKSTDVADDHGALPSSYALKQNYPNPFNPATIIEFSLPVAGNVTLSVYNVLGQKVKDIINGYEPAGSKRATWDGRDAYGREVESGVYFYRLTADSFSMTRKMMLLK